jgi:hypothetical protein
MKKKKKKKTNEEEEEGKGVGEEVVKEKETKIYLVISNTIYSYVTHYVPSVFSEHIKVAAKEVFN